MRAASMTELATVVRRSRPPVQGMSPCPVMSSNAAQISAP
jgi:hypothetical protein